MPGGDQEDRPDRTEITACRPWLTAELDVIGPDALVCLGATAGRAVFGPSYRLTASGYETRVARAR